MLLKGAPAVGEAPARRRAGSSLQGYLENEQKAPEGLLRDYLIDAAQPSGPRPPIVSLRT